jgi:hypothetical protein
MRCAALFVASLAADAHAQKPDSLAGVLEAELGLGAFYSTSDLVGVGGYAGLSLGKPLLGACYVQPVLSMEVDLTQTTRAVAMIRCNFPVGIGAWMSIGVGAGAGHHATEDADFNVTTTPMSFRAVELGFKAGGRRRFFVGLQVAFDATAGDANVFILQTTLVRAYP